MNTLSPIQKRSNRIRAKLLSRTDRPRLTVDRSNTHIFAQIIDKTGQVLAAFGSQGLKNFTGNKSAAATEVGKQLGKLAKNRQVDTVVFDRGAYRFHGRVRALAEAVRESGIKF